MKKIAIALVVILVAIVLVQTRQQSNEIKIGVVTALSGDLAYWGESAMVGARLAITDLAEQGIEVKLVAEDAQLDPKLALSAGTKLVAVDDVDAIFAEFTPVSVALSSYLADKDIPFVYDAAAISPLEASPNYFKTYLDYRESCAEVAKVLKERGVEKIGALEMKLEFGALCTEGLRRVYGDNLYIETFAPGTTDLRTQISNLASNDVEAIVNASFAPEMLASLKNIRDLNLDVTFVALTELLTDKVLDEYKGALEGGVFFGLPKAPEKLIERTADSRVSDESAMAFGYLHITQLAEALNECDRELQCVTNWLHSAPTSHVLDFQGYQDRIAKFDTRIIEIKSGQLVDID